MEKLNTCHTQPDVERALQELPVGMEALYDRMAGSIVKQKPEDRDFATITLQFVTCSLRVLTVMELSRALNNDDLLDIQRTVVELCGGFVIIDNSGNISMVHLTAREYLLDASGDRPFHVARDAANRQIFLSCLRCLMATGLRGKIDRNPMPEFLGYAASAWASHLIAAPDGCGETADAIRKFLAGPWVLTWIHILASTQRLGVLVRTSNYLAKYAARHRLHVNSQSGNHHSIKELEAFECWAVDFAKLAGKFGRILQRNPQSIYKIIPAFCPNNSAIYQQFGKAETRTLSVSGFATDNWDDSLGRLSFGFSTYAAFIQAAGANIFVLISSGSVFVYNSSTFDHRASSPIKHGERLYRMQVNSKGTVLITYGYRTTKVWEVGTGTCTLSVANVEIGLRPLVLLLKGNILIVGTDDRRIRALNLDQSPPSWSLVAELEEPELEGHFLNAASHMALNKDGSMATVAYRGHPLSAWETDGPVQIAHLWRKDANYPGEVLEAIWHPHNPQVFGLYTTGQIFQWSPYEGEVEEKPVGANRLTMSRDGNLLATGDARGSVKVFTTSTLSHIYHVASQDVVLGLAFSPDIRRLYDIRGFYGNVWGPNALLKYAEPTADTESDIESLSQGSIPDNTPKWIDPVTALATSPAGRLYCCGTEKGIVTLYEASHGKIGDIPTSRSLFGIDHMTWSPKGQLLCFSDLSKRVSILSIEPSTSHSNPTIGTPVTIPMQSSAQGPIIQLLFQPDSSHILVHTDSMVHTISVTTSSVVRSSKLATPKCRWIIHPQDPNLVIGLGPNSAHILDWELVERQTYKLDYPISQYESSEHVSPSPQSILERVLVAHDKTHILCQISTSDQPTRDKTFISIKTNSLSASLQTPPGVKEQENITVTIRPTVLPVDVSSQIALALGFLPNNRLVILSKTFQVCLWKIPATGFGSSPAAASRSIPTIALPGRSSMSTPSNRHNQQNGNEAALGTGLFYLPEYWISRECLLLCSVWTKERSLLCPRNGEVAVVRSAALV